MAGIRTLSVVVALVLWLPQTQGTISVPTGANECGSFQVTCAATGSAVRVVVEMRVVSSEPLPLLNNCL